MNDTSVSYLPRASFAERALTFLNVFGPLVGFVIAVVHFWNDGITPLNLALLVLFYFLTGFGVTVGFHRLFTHRSYTTGPIIRFFLALFGSMAVQGPVLWWCHFHRIHHQHSDTADDVHSPHGHGSGLKGYLNGFWYAHIFWLFKIRNPEWKTLARSTSDMTLRVLSNAYVYLFLVALSFFLPGFIAVLITGTWSGFWLTVLWAGVVRIFLVHHVTWSINSVCHLWGRRTFNTKDQSRDNLPLALIGFGEGHHNSHHAFPNSARHGLKWWQLDLTWIIIWTMGKIGLARNIIVPSLAERERKQAV